MSGYFITELENVRPCENMCDGVFKVHARWGLCENMYDGVLKVHA